MTIKKIKSSNYILECFVLSLIKFIELLSLENISPIHVLLNVYFAWTNTQTFYALKTWREERVHFGDIYKKTY